MCDPRNRLGLARDRLGLAWDRQGSPGNRLGRLKAMMLVESCLTPIEPGLSLPNQPDPHPPRTTSNPSQPGSQIHAKSILYYSCCECAIPGTRLGIAWDSPGIARDSPGKTLAMMLVESSQNPIHILFEPSSIVQPHRFTRKASYSLCCCECVIPGNRLERQGIAWSAWESTGTRQGLPGSRLGLARVAPCSPPRDPQHACWVFVQ